MAGDGGEKLLELWWWWFECGQSGGELVEREYPLVPPMLVLVHDCVERTSAGEELVNRRGAGFCVVEGVADALCGDRILRVAGIADEYPARSERGAEEVGDAAADDASVASGGAYAGGEGRLALERGEVARFEVATEHAGLGVGAADEYEGEVVVGGDRGDAAIATDNGGKAI